MNRWKFLATLGVILFFALTTLHCGSSNDVTDNETDWSWIGADEGTYWYVPEENLQAILWDPESPTEYSSIDDQTVWHIESYDNGYFFGPVVVQFEGYPPACQYMTGSVTPNGEVYISFTSTATAAITTGTGEMVTQDGDWTFNMQMASGIASLEVSHWAFMVECTSEQPCWDDIPGSDQTISELLASCE